MLKQELYTYNEQGLRIKKEEYKGDNVRKTYYVYSGNDILFTETYINDKPVDMCFNLVDMASFTYHYGDNPQEELNYYYKDHRQNRIVKTEANGGIVSSANKFGYSSWGELDNSEATEESWFTGKKQDESGLYYFNARYYDADMGKFLQEDTAKQGNSWYTYCNNNPINMFDPDGNDPGFLIDGTSALQLGTAAGAANITAKIIQFSGSAGISAASAGGAILTLAAPIVIADIITNPDPLYLMGPQPTQIPTLKFNVENISALCAEIETKKKRKEQLGDLRVGSLFGHMPRGVLLHGYDAEGRKVPGDSSDVVITFKEIIERMVNPKTFDLTKWEPMKVKLYRDSRGNILGGQIAMGGGQHRAVALMAKYGKDITLGQLTEGVDWVEVPRMDAKEVDLTDIVKNLATEDMAMVRLKYLKIDTMDKYYDDYRHAGGMILQ